MKQIQQNIIGLFTPNKHVSSSTKTITIVVWTILVIFYWSTSNSKLLPKPWAIVIAMKDLIVNLGFARDLIISLTLCLKAMFYSIIISAVIAYASVLAGLKPAMQFVAKARFMTTIGLTFLVAQMMSNASDQKMALLVFGIVVFLTTSFLQVIASVTKDDLDYARTLKFGPWRTMYEVIILGKASEFWEAIIANFAMAYILLAFVENICRSEGGLGVVISDQSKHFHLDAVYAIQIVVLLVGIFFDWLLGKLKGLFFPYSIIKTEK